MSTKASESHVTALREAYLQTRYCFVANGSDYAIEVGKRSSGLLTLASDIGASTAAFITAVNPCSLQLGDIHNNLAMHALREDIGLIRTTTNNSITVFDGQGKGADGSWPPEKSYMVMGITLDEAKRLGRKYGQNAFVWVDAVKGIPELIELADLEKTRGRRRVLPPFKWIRLCCKLGYEPIYLELTPRQYLEIVRGDTARFISKAWNDGESFELEWNFAKGRLRIDVSDGGVAFDGDIDDLDLWLPEPRGS